MTFYIHQNLGLTSFIKKGIKIQGFDVIATKVVINA